MMNSLFEPQSVVVFGGSSEIAQAIVAQSPGSRLRRVVLAGRHPSDLGRAADELALKIGSNADIEVVAFDAQDTESHAGIIEELFKQDVDLALMAFGVLGEQLAFEADSSSAVQAAQVNYVGTVSAGLEVAKQMRRQGHGCLVVLSSVAGLRARRSNFVYGSTKAGLDVFAQGLGDSLQGSGARVMVVRPGFVHTRMTTGLPAAPLSVTPERVARDTIRGLRSGAHTVYSPGALRFVMSGLRAIPRPVFRRLPI